MQDNRDPSQEVPPCQGGTAGGSDCQAHWKPEGRKRTLSDRPLAIANQRGQALAEMGIVILLLVALTIGVMEFGRAWMVLNMITHAARDGARSAALVPSSNRNGDGSIKDPSGIIDLVRAEIGSVLDDGTADALSIPPPEPLIIGGTPMVTVRVSGDIPYLFGLFGDSFSVNRSVTFRDEGR